MFEAGYKIRWRPAARVPADAPVLGARDVLRHLRGGLGTLALCGVLAVAAARATLALVSPSYTALIQIMLDPAGLNVVAKDIADRRPQWDSGITQVESQVRVVRSDNVLRRVVRRLDLARDPEFGPSASDDPVIAWLARALTDRRPGADPVEVALDGLRKAVTVRRADQTIVIDVFVETREADKSARIANAIADSFLEEEARTRSGTALRLSDAMGKGLADLRRDVEDTETRTARYRAENDLVGARGMPLNEQQLGDLNRQLAAAAIRTAEAQARLDQARSVRADEAGTALPEMLQSRELRSLRQQEAALSRSMAELAARLGSRHPALAEQAAQQRDLQRQVQREKARIIDNTQKEYERAAASEAAIRQRFEAAKAAQLGTDRAEVGLRELTRELGARKAVYEANLRRARDLGEQAEVGTAKIRILAPATAPALRSWPPPARLLLPQALALGLVVGVTLCLMRGVRRDRRRAAKARIPILSPGHGEAGVTARDAGDDLHTPAPA